MSIDEVVLRQAHGDVGHQHAQSRPGEPAGRARGGRISAELQAYEDDHGDINPKRGQPVAHQHVQQFVVHAMQPDFVGQHRRVGQRITCQK